VRKMQEYGVLPRDLAPDAALDPYAVDRAYWRLFEFAGSQEQDVRR